MLKGLKERKNLKLTYQIIILIVIILVLPLFAIVYYFYSSTMNSMEQIGEEQAITSIHIAERLIENLGEDLLAVVSSNSHWEDYRTAIKDKDLSWIEQNVDENLKSVPILDFVVTTDNEGKILSAAEKDGRIVKDLDYASILQRLTKEEKYSGLIKTTKGLAIISASKVTNEEGNAPPTGNLIFGRLLNSQDISDIQETLQANLVLATKHGQAISAEGGITKLPKDIPNKPDYSISYETTSHNDTITVHVYKPISDISNEEMATVYIQYPLSTSTKVLKNMNQMSLFNGIMIILLLVILTAVLQRRILMPLKHFKTALEQVATGSSIKEIPAKVMAHAEDNIIKLFEQLHRLSNYDYLTELPNRRYSSRHLEQTLKNARDHNQKVAVMYFDLDRFKYINDSLGHRTGDNLLKLVAERVAKVVPQNGMAARLGGDEFIIILPEVTNLKEVESIAENIKDIHSAPFLVDSYDLFVTSSIGISIFPDDGDTAEALLMNADVAMYRAKEQGRNKFQFYSSNMNSRLIDKIKMESMLSKAVEDNELFLVYQPKYRVQTNEIIGMEALIRWLHPELGIIPPNDFIPLAEETGLIVSIGKWVLKTACAQNKQWQDEGLPPLRVAVNISARQFQHEDIVKTVKEILKETQLKAEWLELEITESTIMKYGNETVKILKKLKSMGISVSIDDFGTGYSSLSYLKLFPVNGLKIDQSFIKDIHTDRGDLAIVKSAITLGHAMNFEVVAEGVETEQHVEILKKEKCDVAQGYFYSRPVTAEAFEKMLRENFKDQSSVI
ncbi:EAL domain-containing protein [Peribacillus sp. SCS-155]|uniref:bifunctional diguanylate cyclase/phosphodiesterase n=1 Tax=Peribacillus sedimenti TaxID=3115297 RepID=UPI0039068AC3